MSQQDLKSAEVFYPESDGIPMESDLHRDLMCDLIAAARYHFRDRLDFYVSGNLFIYYEEGNPRKSIGPDFFAVRGIASHRRRVFKLWEEANGPEIVIEITSRKTHREDLGKKRDVYTQLGVQEYFLVDPEGIRFDPQLRGFRLRTGSRPLMQPVAATRAPNGALRLESDVLGLTLEAHGEQVRFLDSKGDAVPTPEDFLQRAEAERAHAEAERTHAEAERTRAEAERTRAEAERTRADTAELELARLRDEVARLRRTHERDASESP